MIEKRLPRVFLCPLEICGFYGALNSGLRELGAVSHFLDMGDDFYRYGSGGRLHPILWLFHSSLRGFRSSRSLSRGNPLRYAHTVVYLLCLGILLAWMAVGFDVIVFKSGIGLLDGGQDIRLMKRLGKTVVFIFHGSDSRPPYINASYRRFSPDWLVNRTRETADFLRSREPYADYVVDNPLSSHLHTRVVCGYQLLGNAVDKAKIDKALQASGRKDGRSAVRILHAPSNPEIKGTDLVRQAVANLRAKGYDIDYHELSGVPNAVVMQEIRNCDFIVDELYSDMHGAMLSLEAAALGRPSVVGGYGFHLLDQYTPGEARVPTVTCRAEEVEATIERLVSDNAFRQRCGEQAKEFADRYATPKSVASRFLQLVTGNAPASWFFDPKDSRYFAGLGSSEENVRQMIRSVLAHAGDAGFALEDKPEVLERLKIFAGEEGAS